MPIEFERFLPLYLKPEVISMTFPRLKPLSWPEDFNPEVGLAYGRIGAGTRRARRFVQAQLRARPAIPPEIWGNERRCEMAAFLLSLLPDLSRWGSDRFIPEDSLEILFGYPWDGDWGTDLLLALEGEFLREIQAGDVSSYLKTKTFGEFVDYLLEQASDWPFSEWVPPEKDREGLGGCATSEVFHELSAFLVRRGARRKERFRPSMPLKSVVFKGSSWRFLNDYLKKRFNADPALSSKFLKLVPSGWTWIFLTGIAYLVLFGSNGSEDFWWNLLLTPIATAIVVGWLSWGVWRKDLRTVRDLVHFAVQEDYKKRGLLSQAPSQFLK